MAMGQRVIVALCMFTSAYAARVNFQKQATFTQGECEEKKAADVCECEYKRWFGGYQCSACKDPNKWGYGCDLTCPEACTGKCDFAGNCPGKELCPKNCKYNDRVANPTKKVVCVNSEGTCQACEAGFFGLMCEEKCPENCDTNGYEGHCSRAGFCYNCKRGFFGAKCEKECPSACPICMQTAGLDESGEEMPAGSCLQPCEGDFWGAACEGPCPTHCDSEGLTAKASCTRDAGICKKCEKGFWGEKCENECSQNCDGGICRQADGFCLNGCASQTLGVPSKSDQVEVAFYGDDCSKTCPDFTLMKHGCDRNSGLPSQCDATHFPRIGAKDGIGFCDDCPTTCTDNECDNKGLCTKGCDTGYFGLACEKTCPDNCDGDCDRETGQCSSCTPGRTGRFCREKCHDTCLTCAQFHVGSKTSFFNYSQKPGKEPEDCMSCPEDDAAELAGATPTSCDCIRGANRQSAEAKCTCEDPEDEFMEGFFERNPKKCSTKCKSSHNGQELRSVYGDGEHKCIYVNLYNSVVVANHLSKLTGMGGDGCESNEYAVDVFGEMTCLREDFVKYITGK